MKKITLLFFILITFGIYSCDKNQIDSVESSEFESSEYDQKGQGKDGKNGNNGNNGNNVDLPFTDPGTFESIENEQDYCGVPIECTFWAGQTIDAGSVTVSNDENYLYVKVYSKAGFQDVSENIKMWIGLTPPPSRPSSGQFPYKVTETGDTHIFKIELSTLPEWDTCGKSYVIIVHGDVLTEEGNSGSGETAYGGCYGTDGQPWWAYMDYKTECCEEEEPILGWLYKDNNPNDFVTCVKDNNDFGFSNELHYTWLTGANPFYPIWMNVETDCGIDNVVQIGNIWLSVVDKESNPEIKLEIIMFESYTIDELDVYVGWTNPVVNGGLNESLENIPVNGNSYIYTKEVSTMQGTPVPPSNDNSEWYNPGFYIIAKTILQ